jgi:phytanoyl-CoA hydroxylase
VSASSSTGPADRRTVAIDRSEFRAAGYVLVRRFFDPAAIERVRQDAKEVFLAQLRRHGLVHARDVSEEEFESALFQLFARHQGDFVNCGKQAQHLVSLHRLALDERIMSALGQLGLDSPNINTRPVLYFNSRHLAREAVYWRVFAHQDWRSMQGSLDGVVVWVPLTDIDVPLGALEIVPGSHRFGLLEASEVVNAFGRVEGVENCDFNAVEVEQGDALFLSAFMVHRSGTNVTRSIRWSCHFRYNNLAEPTFIERGYPHSFVYRPSDELLTPGFPTREQVQRVFE